MIKELAVAGSLIMSSFSALAQSAPDLNPPTSQLIPAQLQVMCGTLAQLEYVLKDYAEIGFARGLVDRDISTNSLVIFVNPKTKSFTVAERTPDGLYCALAIGNGFEPVPEKERKELQDNHDKKNL